MKRGVVIGVSVLTVLLLLTSATATFAAEPVKVGVILPLSGPSATIGQYVREGIEFIVDRVNADGGIKSLGGAKIVLVVADSRGQPEVGMSEAERLILREKVVALLGCFQSGVTLTATTVAEKYGIPFVVVLANSDQITERGYKFTFRPHGTASADQQILLNFLIDMGNRSQRKVQTIAILSDTTEGTQVPAKFWRQFIKEANEKKTADIKIVYDEPFPFGATDFNPVVLKLKNAKPDVMVLVSVSVTDATLLAKTMAMQRFAPNVGVISFGGATLDPTFIASAGRNADYWFTIQGWTKDLLKSQPKWATEMYEGYKKKYGKELTGDVCKVFLDTYTLVYGLEKAKSTDGKKLRDAIASLDVKEGRALLVATTRRVQFGPDGQNPHYESGVAQILNGEYNMVWPDHVKLPTYKITWPAPQWRDR
jgi:branched-chain amino acid transport system substrate-binding protein